MLSDKFYEHSSGSLVDESCMGMARHMARVVGWYTQGGFDDDCGHHHPSGLHYNWTILSVLNENEQGTGEVRYTRCFDAIRVEVSKVSRHLPRPGSSGGLCGCHWHGKQGWILLLGCRPERTHGRRRRWRRGGPRAVDAVHDPIL